MGNVKDARSVSFYPYNRSQILQYVEYTKYINFVKGIAIFSDKQCVFGQKSKNTTTTIQKSNIKTLAGAGD